MTKSVFTEEYEHFRALLIQARKDHDITQAELANRLVKPQSFVSKYERGERRLDLVEFIQVAEALGMSAQQFVADLEKWMRRRGGHKD